MNGRKPVLPTHSQCVECKRQGAVCLMVAKGTPCMGPVCQTGCGNICPEHDRGCYACFGPMETPNTAALAKRMAELGMKDNLNLPDDQLKWRCEQAIRNYDPCISCATHFLQLTIERE